MQDIIFLKLGGGLITDKNKPFTAQREIIHRLGLEIKEALKTTKSKLVIAHGSGSFGHSSAAKYNTQNGVVNNNGVWGVAEVCDAAIRINRIVMEEFLKIKLPAISFAPKSLIMARSGKVVKMFSQPIFVALELGLLPVLYGDVVMDAKKGCGIFSSERIIRELATSLPSGFRVEKVVYCGNTNGVYGADGNTIRLINSKLFKQIQKVVGKSRSVDVTGGMAHKVKEALATARFVSNGVWIINGSKREMLKAAICGKLSEGTVIKI